MVTMSDNDSFSEGEISKLCRKALYVRPAPRTIDLNTVPTDGHEYIHKLKLEDSLLEFPIFNPDSNSSKESCEKNLRKPIQKELKNINKRWIRTTFCLLVSQLKANKQILKNKYPLEEPLPLDNEEECCTFCLGSNISSSIYENVNPNAVKAANLPLLHHVIHLTREELMKLMTYMCKWVEIVGMREIVCKWFFALFACLNKPISEREEDLLEDLFENCKDSLKKSKDEFIRLYFISSILKHYYLIKGYTVGDSLWLMGDSALSS